MDIGSDKRSPINRAELKDVDIGTSDGGINTYTIDDDDNNYSNSGSANGNGNENGTHVRSYVAGIIPLENADVGSSLPSVEELKQSVAINSSGRSIVVANGGDYDPDGVIGRDNNDVDAGVDSYNDFTSTARVEKSRRRFRYVVFSLLCILLLSIIIGVAMSISGRTSNNGGGGSPNGSSSNEPRKVDVESLRLYLLQQYDIQFNVPSDGTGASSPQYQAAAWMANEDSMNMKLPSTSPSDKVDQIYAYRYLSRYVLALTFFATDGMNSWINPLSFLSGQDICDWQGRVYTRYTTFLAGVNCLQSSTASLDDPTALDNVTTVDELLIPDSLSLYYNGLKGTIPTELALLSSLRVIDLKWNDLDTTIPTEICSLTNLRSLFLGYNNNVKGKIPTCIGELSKLERFFASNNIITGELPSSLKKLSSLERLIIDDNLLNGDPTDLFVDMKNLSMLMLNSNSFTGTINSEFLSEHPLLSILDISNNNFTVAPGSDLALPRHLMKLKELRILDFSYNKLTGSLPESFFDEPNSVLNMFSLYGNKITGSIPASIGNCSNLTHFDISDNLITGIIPTTIYALQNLTTLFISNNPTMEEAPIPVELSSMKKLKEISMRNSSRSGELFHHLGGLQKLVLLDLSSNPSLEGTIPEQWGNLTKLEFLLLQNNPGINGSIPSTFTRLENLRAAFIDGTGLTGTVEPICSLERFATVNLTQGEFIYATCLDTTNNATASVSCDCCVCCNETSGTKSCSNPSVGNLDASWEFDYKRYIYPFWTNEGYFVSSKENT